MKKIKLNKLLALMAVTLVTSVAILPTKASAAWKQTDNGNWNYTDGDSLVSGWKSIDGKWYFFDSNGNMKTGWTNDGGTWYYLASSGDMKTGWINDGGKWYYTNPSGDMKTGWLLDNGSWYYLNSTGSMQTGLVDVSGKTYYLSESGAMKTGNITVNGVNYTFAASGEKVNSSTANQTASGQAANTDSTTSTTASSGSSGGSGGSGGGSSSSTTSYYKSLYGTWKVGEYIDSNTTLTDDQISLCEGQIITIKSNSISIDALGGITISNPSIKEGTMTTSSFYSKYNVKVSGDNVKYVSTTIKYSSLNVSIPVTIYIAENEDNEEVYYALVKGALFKLEKQ
jgi:fructan beta-fructosidase